MNFELFISLRYLKAKRGKSFLSLLTLISIAGVAVGVMTLIVVLAVMNGFQGDVRDKILGVTSHAVVFKIGDSIDNYRNLIKKIERVKGVTGATPYLQSQVMIAGFRGVSGAVLRGIDPRSASRVTKLAKTLRSGSIKDLGNPQKLVQFGKAKIIPSIILGSELASNLGVTVNSIVNVISPAGRITPLGQVPKSKKFKVTGIFESGMYDYDNTLSFISLREAQHFLGLGDVCTGIEIRVKNIYEANRIAKDINTLLGSSYLCRDWIQMNKNLFSALKLEKTVMFIILTLIILVAAFNIISTLIMVVMEKTRDIAILKAMGATKKAIMRIFMWEGIVIGSIGTALGLLGGFVLCALLQRYKFIQLPSDVYTISTLPVKIEGFDIVIIALAAMVISFLATLYPSWKASHLNPAEALRYG